MARILVIDDNPEFLETIRLLLEQRGGHQATLRADGPEGLEQAFSDPPDLIISDVMMPEIAGYEICRQLRANPATASIPIIILTARGQAVDQQAALDAGADDYMVKPVPMDELLERINNLLTESSPAESPAQNVTVTWISLRGGVGVTTLATNVAATFAQAAKGAVCLVDLCPSSGNVALQLGLRPEPNWSDLLPSGTPDQAAVEAHLLQHPTGLHVLASPVVPAVDQVLFQATTTAILKAVQQRFRFVFVDTPSALSEATMVALKASTVAGLVLTAEPAAVQATVATLRALNPWSSKLQVILNQVVPGGQAPTEAIERALKRTLLARVPFDPAQARALAQGAPLSLHNPGAPLAQAAKRLAQELSRQPSRAQQ